MRRVMFQHKSAVLGLVALMALLLASACGGGGAAQQPAAPPKAPAPGSVPAPAAAPKAPAPAPAPAAPPKVVKIGATVPLSGALAKWGNIVRTGMELALEEINREGYIPGVKLELVLEDSQGQPAAGISALRKLVTVDKVPIVQTIFTNIGLAQAPVATDLGVVLYSSGIQHPEFGKMSPWTFRNAANTRHNADAWLRYFRDERKEGPLKWGVLYLSGNDSIRLMTDRLQQLLKVQGGEVVALESYGPEDKDFRTQLTKIKAKSPDVFTMVCLGTEAGLIINQAVELGLNPKYRVGTCAESANLVQVSGKAAEGYLYSSPAFDVNSLDPRTQRFVKAYKAKLNENPDGVAAAYYDGTFIIAEAMKKAGGSYTAADIKRGLEQVTSYDGLSGRYIIDPQTGDGWQSLAVKVVKDGKYQLVIPVIAPYTEVE